MLLEVGVGCAGTLFSRMRSDRMYVASHFYPLNSLVGHTLLVFNPSKVDGESY